MYGLDHRRLFNCAGLMNTFIRPKAEMTVVTKWRKKTKLKIKKIIIG